MDDKATGRMLLEKDIHTIWKYHATNYILTTNENMWHFAMEKSRRHPPQLSEHTQHHQPRDTLTNFKFDVLRSHNITYVYSWQKCLIYLWENNHINLNCGTINNVHNLNSLQWSPMFLPLGTSFAEGNFSMDYGWGMVLGRFQHRTVETNTTYSNKN